MSNHPEARPAVGVGVIIVRHNGDILVGKRKSHHAPYWSIPGGHLELGESFEQAAIREIKEETGLTIHRPQVIAVTNNLQTFAREGKHTISICLLAQHQGDAVINREPEKCEGWQWVNPDNLPEPHFEASQLSVACYLQQRFYSGACPLIQA